MADQDSRKQDVVAVASLVAVVTAWFYDVLFLGRAFYARDIFNYHYPLKKIFRDMVLAGEWPMWSPNFAAGQPMAANPAYEVFYPPQLLILLPDIHLGMSLHIAFHFYLCGIGLYFLLRSLGAGSAASLLGSIGYTIGGPYLSLIRTLPFLFSMAWAPLIFLFARRFFLTRQRRDAAIAAIFGGMQALVAEPTTMLQTWLIVAAYAGYRVMREPPRVRGKVLRHHALGLLVIGLFAAVIGAAQLVPMLDFVRDSVRSERLDWTLMIAKWSLAPSRVLELFYPLVFYSLIDFSGKQWILSLYNLGEPFISNFYPGVFLGILFVAGFVAWRRGSGFVLALCGGLYILAIGANTPLLRFLYDIGVFATMRFPEKFAMGASLVVVIWAALTADLLFRGDERVRRAVLYVTGGWFVLGFLLVLAAARVWQLFWVVTFARGVIVLLIVLAMRRWKSPLWAAALVIFTLLDIVHLRGINPTITRDYFEPPPLTRQLSPEKDDYRIFHGAEWEWMAALPNADAYFYHPDGRWWTLRNSLMTRNAAWWGYQYVLDRDYDQTLLKPTERYTFAMFEMIRSQRGHWREAMFAMSNAWYYGRFRLAAEELRRTGGEWQRMMPVDFYPAAERYPRYYFADEIVPAADVHEFVRKVLEGTHSKRAAYVDWQPFQPAGGTVRGFGHGPRKIRIEAESEGRSLLIISVTRHKYWRARVNGQPAELKPVNINYQAIELPAGRHVVQMEYWNPLVVPSLIVSVIALIAAVAVTLKPSPRESGERVAEDPVRGEEKKKRKR